MKPLQCYFSAFKYTGEWRDSDLIWDKRIDRELWFDEECGPMLDDACKRNDALGSTDYRNYPAIDDFCAYHRYVYDAIGTTGSFQEWVLSRGYSFQEWVLSWEYSF